MFFENSSLKGISGQNMSDPLKWSLTGDSRFLQAAILRQIVQNLLREPSDGKVLKLLQLTLNLIRHKNNHSYPFLP